LLTIRFAKVYRQAGKLSIAFFYFREVLEGRRTGSGLLKNGHRRSLRRFQHAQCGPQNLILGFAIADRPHRTAHQERRQQDAGKRHLPQWLFKGGHGNHDGRNSRLFHQTRNVSHGHVTDRSDGHQQCGIDLLFLESPDPVGTGDLLQAGLGAGSDK